MGKLKKLQRILSTLFDIRDTADLIWKIFSIGGATSVITAIANWIGKNIPPLSLILFGIGLFMFFLAVLPRVIPSWFGFFRKPKTKTQPKEWLEQVLTSDREHLDERIKREIYPNYWHLEKGIEPCLQVEIRITNNAVFPISIVGIEGSFRIEGVLCLSHAVLGESGYKLFRLDTKVVSIKQSVHPETIRTIANYPEGRDVQVDLKDCCYLIVRSEEPDQPTTEIRISAGETYTVKRHKFS